MKNLQAIHGHLKAFWASICTGLAAKIEILNYWLVLFGELPVLVWIALRSNLPGAWAPADFCSPHNLHLSD